MTDNARTSPETEHKKKWVVTTRATVTRTYFVDAHDAKGAEEASCGASFDSEEDENEETIDISEANK